MRRPQGYATIVDPDKPLFERDTISCGHCSGVVFVKPGTGSTVYLIADTHGHWQEEAGAFCRLCMTPVCLQCHDKGHCVPLERWLEQVEQKAGVLTPMKRVITTGLLCAWLLLGLSASVRAQVQVIPIDSLPVVLIVSWDDDSADQQVPTSYEVILDNMAPITVLPAQPAPCTDCASAALTVATIGPHTVTVRGRNGAGVGEPAMVAFTVSFALIVPVMPTNLRIRVADPVSPPGTAVPPATSITAVDYAVWTISTPLPPSACPNVKVPDQCRSLLRTNVEVGRGYELWVAATGALWAHGYEGLWYQWTGASFLPPGQLTKPQ